MLLLRASTAELRSNKRSLVFALLRQKRFDVIQSAMVLRAVSKQERFSLNFSG